MGRPSVYSPELADMICERLASGDSLLSICEGEGMSEATVRNWVTDDRDGFAARYARAREAQADHYADKIVKVAFGVTDAQLGRLQVDALKWAASKLAPKKYGDKIEHEHNGSLTVEIVRFGDNTPSE